METPIIIFEDDSELEQIGSLFQLLNNKDTIQEIKEILEHIYEKAIKSIHLQVKRNGFEKNLFEFLHELKTFTDIELKRIGGEDSIQEETDYKVKISDVQDVLVYIVRSLSRLKTNELEKPEYYLTVINNFKKMKNELLEENKVADKYWAFEKKAFRQILNKYTKEKIKRGKKVQFTKIMYLNLVISVLIGLADETYDVLGDHINKGNKKWEKFKKKHEIGRGSQAYVGLLGFGG